MPDREKVIKKFTDYVHYFKPYCLGDIEDHAMLKDVVELLKEQEAVKPVQHLVYTTKGWFCGACNGRLNRLGKYCSFCGREVKWE